MVSTGGTTGRTLTTGVPRPPTLLSHLEGGPGLVELDPHSRPAGGRTGHADGVKKAAFRRWSLPQGTSLSTLFRPGESRCGIYILEFAGGQRYVGQSHDVVRRVATHSRHFGDVVAVQFAPVDPNDLDAAERQVVQAQKDAGVPLRNIDLVTRSWADSVLDQVVDPEVQSTWVQGGPQPHPDDTRMLIAKRRAASARKYRELRDLASFPEVFSDVCTYVDRVITWPSATDGRFWTLTALPGTGLCAERRRLAAVSCGKVETFVVFEDRTTHETWWFLNMEHGVLRRSDLPPEFRDMLDTDAHYRTTGRIDRLLGGACGSLASWFDESPQLLTAARELALNLLRKGPSLFARFHCDALVDDVLLELNRARSE